MKLLLKINNEKYEIETDPRELLIDVLRNELNLMGTKCGCGEGECGACTVILNGQAVNSCLTTVGQAHGAYINTIEGLASTKEGETLLNVLTDKGAVQCGFCTPGIAVSSSVLLNQKSALTDKEVRHGLSGHLCRCTGYVKIIDAVKAAATQKLDLSPLLQKGYLTIDASESPHFVRLDDLNSALKILSDPKKNWRILAGGTDLFVQNEKRLNTLNMLDISGIRELRGIIDTGTEIQIGSATSFTEILNSADIKKQFPILQEAARQIGGVQIQNSGTIGGNIATGSPAADIIPPLMALGASIEIVSSQKSRVVPIKDFFTGLNQTVLKPGELIKQINLTKSKDRLNEIEFFDKLGTRKALSITKVSIAFYGRAKDNQLKSVTIAMGSVGENVKPAPKTTEFLMQGKLTKERLTQAGDILSSEISPIDDLFSTEEYCRQAAKGLLIKNLWEYAV